MDQGYGARVILDNAGYYPSEMYGSWIWIGAMDGLCPAMSRVWIGALHFDLRPYEAIACPSCPSCPSGSCPANGSDDAFAVDALHRGDVHGSPSGAAHAAGPIPLPPLLQASEAWEKAAGCSLVAPPGLLASLANFDCLWSFLFSWAWGIQATFLSWRAQAYSSCLQFEGTVAPRLSAPCLLEQDPEAARACAQCPAVLNLGTKSMLAPLNGHVA